MKTESILVFLCTAVVLAAAMLIVKQSEQTELLRDIKAIQEVHATTAASIATTAVVVETIANELLIQRDRKQ